MAEHANTFFLLSLLTLLTVLLVFGMKYFSVARQAASRIAGEEGWRTLSTQSTTAQAEAGASIAALRNELSEIKARLASIEKVLKEVE